MAKVWLIFGAVLLAGHFTGLAQEADLKEKFAQAQKENSAALAHFTWKSRTDLTVKGESKKVKVEQVRYGSDGNLQKTTLEESSPPPPNQKSGRRGGRLKQKVVENKKEEFAELMQKLVVVAQSYAHIPPPQMQAFLKNASISPDGETIQIAGSGALNPSDRMKIWIVKGTLMVRKVEIHTSLDQKPVNLTTEFIQLTNGPSVQSRAVLDYPDKGILIKIDSFDHQQL